MLWYTWGLLALSFGVVAENGLNGWLRYAPLPDELRQHASSLPSRAVIVALNETETSPVYVAGKELQAGLKGVLGYTLSLSHNLNLSASTNSSAIILVGTLAAYNLSVKHNVSTLAADGFWLNVKGGQVTILGQNERGALYGAFEYLSMIAQGDFSDVDLVSSPSAPIRWVNEWDNLDGTIERGYAGASIFFRNGAVVEDLTRAAQYARLLASIRINGIVLNNVNANATLLTAENMDGLGRIADAMRPYGVQVGISLNFASPQTLGGLATFDPLDPSVVGWWTDKTAQLYQRIPDFAGYLVKANSEGQPGPLTYNRTLADGANLFARAVLPHGGVVMFRAFVYNNHLDPSDWKADRANAAVDFFQHLDGHFLDNVVVQIKYGPIDFQVREPPSPLFAHLPHTNAAIELQISQEYLGQQSHLVYLAPLWKSILDFDLCVDGQPSLVRSILSGARFGRKLSGYAGVVNVGTNPNWLGSHMAMSNLFAFGHLAWDPTQNPQTLLETWTRLTFSLSPTVLSTVTSISMASWPAYENYTGNLGMQTLTDILYTHFGPNPASHDNNGWGQWTRADSTFIGMDRTVSNGTGFAGQYPPDIAAQFEAPATTPDELLLWFHHVPYTHRLRGDGKTVIQHLYDAHYAGAQTAQGFLAAWAALRDDDGGAAGAGAIDAERFDDVLFQLTYQAGHALVWRDAIAGFYHNLSWIADEHGRVGYHPHRIEAENMVLRGYVAVGVTPAVTASNGTAIVVADGGVRGEAVAVLDGVASGVYDIAIGYFDVFGGRAHYGAFINDEPLVEWIGDLEDRLGHVFSTKLDGHSATRVTVKGVGIERGDVLKVIGIADGGERAPLDYVAVLPAGVVD
ncbi:glycoside hydrolase superfamily [Podospora appendiculata]|uniref:Alpha-glucuronidase n=1 Tax=Podospora appendiculata TaxID=314037 RepID=A0AAE1CH59_9PEZI|nr:glycoside hydrolase superfamily [Podospora appendiculata]